ncbi:MAG: hypothetical protein MUP81_03265 [Dehalococcoidia bacterium]|nr:hypothetical protein [Dehalococcoidia bacterium]
MATKKPKTPFKIKVALREIAIQIRKFYKIGERPSLKETKAMLAYISDNYSLLHLANGVLKVRTENIYKGGTNYGSCVIILDLKRLVQSDGYYYGLKLKTPKGYRFPHQHVFADSRLCFGDGGSAAKKSVVDGRLDDFLDIIQQILRT